MLHRISVPLALALTTACSGHLDVGSTGDAGSSNHNNATPDDSAAGGSPTDASPVEDVAANPPLDGGPAGTLAQVNGTLDGEPFAPAYAVAFKGVSDPAYPNQLSVFITDISNLCELAQTGGQASFRALLFVLGQTDSAAPSVGPGTYTQTGSPNEGTVAYYEEVNLYPPPPPGSSGGCGDTLSSVTAGNIVISSVGASIAGTFDGSAGTEHPVTATFDAPLCVLPAANGIISLCL